MYYRIYFDKEYVGFPQWSPFEELLVKTLGYVLWGDGEGGFFTNKLEIQDRDLISKLASTKHIKFKVKTHG